LNHWCTEVAAGRSWQGRWRHGVERASVGSGALRRTVRDVNDVPIGHVTNGVHVPTSLVPLMHRLLNRQLGFERFPLSRR